MLTSVAKKHLVSSVCFFPLNQQFDYGSSIAEVTPPLKDPPCSRIAPDGARAALGARQLALDAVREIGLASTAI